jgi:hypothetical protein
MPKTIFLALFALLASLAVAAKTVYVDCQNGQDSQDGLTAASAKKTIAVAVRLLEPGDTLSLAAGQMFYESIALPINGTPAKPITIEGNGAVISGLQAVPEDQWQDKGDGLFFQPAKIKHGALAPYLVDRDSRPLPHGSKPDTMQPGQALCTTDGMYIRCEPGRSPADFGLHVTGRASGVVLSNRSYITVRNLVAEYFSNDGFNIHGYCRGLFFENITSRYNGDDGFSIHEDVAAMVRGGHFHDNNYGIQDVTASRSWYQGVLVENNRRIGVNFHGGARSLEDAVVRNNCESQVHIQSGKAHGLGYTPGNPMEEGLFFFKNVVVIGSPDTPAFIVDDKSKVVVSNCAFLGGNTGVLVRKNGELHLHASIVAAAGREVQVMPTAKYVASANAFHPGRFVLDTDTISLTQFQEATGQEQDSVVAAPVYDDTYRFTAPNVRFLGQNAVAGPDRTAVLPLAPIAADKQVAASAPPKLIAPPKPPQPIALPTPSADGWVAFDFENSNPWNLIYYAPLTRDDGKPLDGTAELSTEQAVSGQSSLRLHVELPPNAHNRWTVKLFSQRLNIAAGAKVVCVRFNMFGDNSHASFIPRFRDAKGELFWGKSGTIDWQGWRLLEWDLTAVPPAIRGGDKNQTLDAPFQFIVDFRHHNIPSTGRIFTVFIDDLQFKLENP